MSEQPNKGRYLRVPLTHDSWLRIQQMSYARNVHLNRLATDLLTIQIDAAWQEHEQGAPAMDPEVAEAVGSLFSVGNGGRSDARSE